MIPTESPVSDLVTAASVDTVPSVIPTESVSVFDRDREIVSVMDTESSVNDFVPEPDVSRASVIDTESDSDFDSESERVSVIPTESPVSDLVTAASVDTVPSVIPTESVSVFVIVSERVSVIPIDSGSDLV